MIKIVTVAQYGLERSAFNRVVGGSNPPRDKWELGIMYYAVIYHGDVGFDSHRSHSSIAQQAEHPAVNR